METLKYTLTLSITPVLVSIFYYLGKSVYRKDKKIFQNDIDNIKKSLNNHVTGTEKQIAQLRTDINAKFDKTDSKIDQLKIDMYTKIDSNFNNILTVLNLSKKNESDFKRNNK